MTKKQKIKAIHAACELLETKHKLFSCCALSYSLTGVSESFDHPLVKAYSKFHGKFSFSYWPLAFGDSHTRILLLLMFAEAGLE